MINEINFQDLPFIPKRIFYMKDIPLGIVRGNHAHKKLQEILFCIQGKFEISLLNPIRPFPDRRSHILSEGESVHIPELNWISLSSLQEGGVLLSLCSHEYDRTDYIEDLGEYVRSMGKTG